MSETLTPDLCIIGAGSGGLSVAAAAAAFGVPVVLIEKGEMGGDCLNVGCVPSKALIAAAERMHAVAGAAAFGIEAGRPHVDPARLREHIRSVIATIAPNDSVARFTALGVTVLRGKARFTDDSTVEVGEHRIKARRFVVATGSTPALPPIRGLNLIPHYTNETIFDLDVVPDHLVILGGGPIGCEIAQARRRLGARVTIVEAARVLGREDPEAAAVVVAALRREGVEVVENTRVEAVHGATSGSLIVSAKSDGAERHFGASHVLVAAGRTPTVEGLGLEAAGIAFDTRAGITVDARLKTANHRVYAIGDCAAGPTAGLRFTHVAGYHAGIVIRNALFGLRASADPLAIPRVTFTDPQIAAVGLSEAEAREKHGRISILRWPFSENDRAQALRRTEGHVKAIAKPNGLILGVSIVGPEAGELLPMWSLALAKDMKLSDLAGIVVPYPTLAEVSRRAAVSYLAPAAANPWLRRAMRILKVFG